MEMSNGHDEVDYEDEVEMIDDEAKNNKEASAKTEKDKKDRKSHKHEHRKHEDKKSNGHSKTGSKHSKTHTRSPSSHSSCNNATSSNKRKYDSMGGDRELKSHEKKHKSSRESDDKSHDYDEEYFRRVLSRTKNVFKDPLDKELYLENIWANVKGKFVPLCTHRASSDCIVWMLNNLKSDSFILEQMLSEFDFSQIKLEFLISFESHLVLESLLGLIVKSLANDENSKTSKAMIKFVESYGYFIVKNLEALLESPNLNTRINRALLTLGGMRVDVNWNRQTMTFISGMNNDLSAIVDAAKCTKEVPKEFVQCLKKLVKALANRETGEEIRNTMFVASSNVAHHMLLVAHARIPDVCQEIIAKMVDVVFENDASRDLVAQSATGAYILEIMMLLSSPFRLEYIWNEHLKGKLDLYWKHDISNYIVQRFIDAIKDENMLSDVCNELYPHLAEIFSLNRPGIGVCIAKKLTKYEKLQSAYIKALLKALECYEPRDKQIDMIPSLLFTEIKDHSGTHIEIWLHGSFITQNLLSYRNPDKVTRSLLSLSREDLESMCKDRSGSHVMECFFNGEHVSSKDKTQLMERLKGRLVSIASDKFGSRVIENMLSMFQSSMRRAILDELSDKLDELKRSNFGWLLAKKYGLYHYKHRPDEWRQVIKDKGGIAAVRDSKQDLNFRETDRRSGVERPHSFADQERRRDSRQPRQSGNQPRGRDGPGRRF